VSGNGKGTSVHPLVLQRWPYPTVGRPTGSGAGLATKPSAFLMRDVVAALTEDGGAQLPPSELGRQQVKLDGPGQSPKEEEHSVENRYKIYELSNNLS